MPWTGVLDSDVIKHVQQREKLPKTELCPANMYDIMLRCWKLDPLTRTAASAIETELRALYEEAKSQMYDELVWPTLNRGEMASTKTEGLDVNSIENIEYFASLEIAPSQLKVKIQLGHGEFGEVNMGVMTTSQRIEREVAVKTLKAGVSDDMRSKFRLEACLLAGLRHPNIVELLAVCFDDHEVCFIVLELMPHGDLQNYLFTRQDELSDAVNIQGTLYGVLEQLLSAMVFLEKKKVLHRDLAARNALVGERGLDCVKLSDLGMSRTLTSSYYVKTSNYRVWLLC